MAELDNLLGSRISLITQQDIRYEGVLFSINQNESSIVLRDGKYLVVADCSVCASIIVAHIWFSCALKIFIDIYIIVDCNVMLR